MSDHDPSRTDRVRYGTIDHEYGLKLATTDPADDGPIWMINLMKYREIAAYGDGRSDISGREADDRYMPIESLNAVGAKVVFLADVEDVLRGDGTAWDRIAVVKYPTRRSFIEMQTRPDFRRQHVHKDAGMERTIVAGGLPFPIPTTTHTLATVEWSEVPHPPTDDDGPVVIMHVLQFHESDGAANTPIDMQTYQTGASHVAVRNGVRFSGWFSVEGTILGDGRPWHQIRFNTFPSRRAFLEVVQDPDRRSYQEEFRERAISDSYSMVLRASIDDLALSVE